MSTTTMNPTVLSAGTVIGETVKNPAGEKLGTIKELMFDTVSGHMAYAVLDFGGFLGIGNKLFAVPWRALKVCPDDHSLQLDVSREFLEQADGFDPDNWPDFADRQWGSRVHSYYKMSPYWS